MKWIIAICAVVFVSLGCSDNDELVRQNVILKGLVEDQTEVIQKQRELISLQRQTIDLTIKEKSE